MAKILIVEDDASLASFVKDSLVRQNHVVDIVDNGEDGLYWLTTQEYSLALVDWDLPKLSGVELCHRYRTSGGNVPILMLTGKGTASDIVHGLDAGADDYLPKPFEMAPLLARVRALLRRPTEVKSSVLRAGVLEVDLSATTVKVNGNTVELTPKEFGLLEFLMRNREKVCSSETLIANVWSTEATTSVESIRAIVNRLRNKLEAADKAATGCIRSVYGMGYKFEL